MGEPMIKGAAIREFLAWYAERHGQRALRSLRERLPPDLAGHLANDSPVVSLLASTWYPARLVHLTLEAIAEDVGEARFDAMLKHATRDLVQQAGNTVYRLVFEKLVTPEMYALLVPRLWRQLHDTGDRSIRVVRPDAVESVVAKWAGHHPLLCTLTIELMCALFEMMGKRDVAWERVACVSNGARECITHVTWR